MFTADRWNPGLPSTWLVILLLLIYLFFLFKISMILFTFIHGAGRGAPGGRTSGPNQADSDYRSVCSYIHKSASADLDHLYICRFMSPAFSLQICLHSSISAALCVLIYVCSSIHVYLKPLQSLNLCHVSFRVPCSHSSSSLTSLRTLEPVLCCLWYLYTQHCVSLM